MVAEKAKEPVSKVSVIEEAVKTGSVISSNKGPPATADGNPSSPLSEKRSKRVVMTPGVDTAKSWFSD